MDRQASNEGHGLTDAVVTQTEVSAPNSKKTLALPESMIEPHADILSKAAAKPEQPLIDPYMALADKAISDAQAAVRLNTAKGVGWKGQFSQMVLGPKAMQTAPSLVVRKQLRSGPGGTVFTSRLLNAPPDFTWAIATDQKFRKEVDSESEIDAVLEQLGTGLGANDAIVHVTTAAKGPVSQRHMTILVHSRSLGDGTIATLVKSIKGHPSDPDPHDRCGWVRMDTTSVIFYSRAMSAGETETFCLRQELTSLDLKLSRFIPIDVMSYIFKKLTPRNLHKLAKVVTREWQRRLKTPSLSPLTGSDAASKSAEPAAAIDPRPFPVVALQPQAAAESQNTTGLEMQLRPNRRDEFDIWQRRRREPRSWLGTVLEDAQPYLVAFVAVITVVRFVRGR